MCTRVFWNDNGSLLMVGRSMDWPESTEPVWTAFPRGSEHVGNLLEGHELFSNPLRWRSTYGSLVVTVYGVGAVDGINEAGLTAHMLYLNETDFGPRDPGKPGVHAGLWAQYLLDTAATVDEALARLNDIQLVMVEARGRTATVHLALEDANGDSAVVEYIDGKPVVHHGKQFQVMTNSPTYDEQLALLAKQDFSNPSSDVPLPGNVNAVDRFQRAAYYLALLPKTENEQEAAAGVLAIMRNVSVPFGAPYKGWGIYDTEYRTVIDITNKRYFFEYSRLPNVIWTELEKFDFSAGSPVMALNPIDIALHGDVSDQFTVSVAPY
jgi:penicillin V acylase-like amidase (Ntn superfamily)